MESLLTVLLTATLTASAFAQESGFLELIDLHADPAKKTEVIGAYAHLQDEYNRLTRWTESL